GRRMASTAVVTATAVNTAQMIAVSSARARLVARAKTPSTAAVPDRMNALRPVRAYRAVAVPTVDAAAARAGTAHHCTPPVPGRVKTTTAPPMMDASTLDRKSVV